jgi:hypothetical protein
MNRRRKPHKKNEFEEQLVQKLPYRCPYCDRPVSYDQFDLEIGENEIQCLSCKKTYIKVISDAQEITLAGKSPSLGGRGGREGGNRVL